MRSFKAAIGRRWWKTVFGGSLILLALAGFVLPDSRAEIVNSGGHVTVHRRPDTPVPVPVPVRRVVPPSYYPDNDSGHPSDYVGNDSARPVSAAAGGPTYGIAADVLPWNRPGFEDYDQPVRIPRDSSLASPRTYSLETTLLPQKLRVVQPTASVLIAHLPEHARFWVEEIRTRLRGQTRYFRSPLLSPGRKYNYTVRADWIEDGRWVSQTRIVPVRAGLIQTIYLQPSPKKSQVQARPAKDAPKATGK